MLPFRDKALVQLAKGSVLQDYLFWLELFLGLVGKEKRKKSGILKRK
jgi:hypothetical protein